MSLRATILLIEVCSLNGFTIAPSPALPLTH